MSTVLLRWLLIIVALLFSLIWLLGVTKVIGSLPDWMPPAGVIALAVAVALP